MLISNWVLKLLVIASPLGLGSSTYTMSYKHLPPLPNNSPLLFATFTPYRKPPNQRPNLSCRTALQTQNDTGKTVQQKWLGWEPWNQGAFQHEKQTVCYLKMIWRYASPAAGTAAHRVRVSSSRCYTNKPNDQFPSLIYHEYMQQSQAKHRREQVRGGDKV